LITPATVLFFGKSSNGTHSLPRKFPTKITEFQFLKPEISFFRKLILSLKIVADTRKQFHSFSFAGVYRKISSPFPNPVNKREF